MYSFTVTKFVEYILIEQSQIIDSSTQATSLQLEIKYIHSSMYTIYYFHPFPQNPVFISYLPVPGFTNTQPD